MMYLHSIYVCVCAYNFYILTMLKVSPSVIIALSASSSKVDEESIIEAGCNDFMMKPYSMKIIQDKIESVEKILHESI